MAEVRSFSVKKGEDLKFVDDLKAKYAKEGKSFSFIVIKALRAYEQTNRQR